MTRTKAIARGCACLATLWFAGAAPAQTAASAADTTNVVLGAMANPTTPGEVLVYTTMLSAGFEWRIGGDDDADCTVGVDYRKFGDVDWKPAQPLMRVEPNVWTHGESPGNLLAGSIFMLLPATSYEARLTLYDPDGGWAQRAVSFTTRSGRRAVATRTRYVTPGTGGGTGTQLDPYRGLAAADASAQPGDLFILQSGTYLGTFAVTRNGTPTSPIAYRGVDQASVILDGDGGTSSVSHCVNLNSRQHVYIENMSLTNCLRPVSANNSVGVVVRGCLIRPINQLLSIQAIHAALSRDLLITNNTIQMPGQWATIGRTGSYGVGGYAILIEGTGHVVCHNTITESWDAVSIPVTGTGVPACTTSNVDIYANFVDRASDDGVQADAIQQNVRIFANRLLNTGSAVSFQPSFGGPGYVMFNEIYNTRIEPYKFHQETFYGWTQETSGFLVFHNTSICNRNGWLETGIWRNGKFRNNLILGARVNVPTFSAGYTYPRSSFNADGYNRVNGFPTLVNFSGANYANLPAFYAATANEQNGIEVGTSAFVNAPLPHHPEWNYTDGYGTPYTPAQFDLRLAASSVAANRGVTLANINDGFAGSAPDLGCYESGKPVPAYGARPQGQALAAGASSDPSAGVAPLTVRFTGASQYARGIVVAYHWSFGDGSIAQGVQNPVHTYLRGGAFTATLTVIDDDGSVAIASVPVIVTGPITDAPATPMGLALAQNVPNPFTGSTTIPFILPQSSRVTLGVYDLGGALVKTLVDGALPAGGHSAIWDGRTGDGRRAMAGVYFLRLLAGERQLTRRVALVR